MNILQLAEALQTFHGNVNMDVTELVLGQSCMVRPTRPLSLCANIFPHCIEW